MSSLNRSRLLSPAVLSLTSSFIAVCLIGCGSDDEPQGEVPFDLPNGSPSGDGDFTLGDGDGDSGIPMTRDGGRVDLSQEEISAIETASCTGWQGEGEMLPAVLQLVVDVSLSMNQPPSGGPMVGPGPGFGQTKWTVTRDALSDAIQALPPSVSVGVLYYPNMSSEGSVTPTDISACVATEELVPIEQLGNEMSAHRTTINQSLQSARVDSYTPTYDAYTYALENSLLPYPAEAGNKFMLLITDGAPTFDQGCENGALSDDTAQVVDAPTEPIVDKIADAFASHGVRTFLIGSPGSEQSSESDLDMRPWLSQAAKLGGTALDTCSDTGPDFCHLDMTQEPDFGQALSQGLSEIAGQIVNPCNFVVPEAEDGGEVDPDKTNLVIDWGDGTASLILPDETGECMDGWRFNETGEVQLCPLTCEQINSVPEATVDLTFGCTLDEVTTVIR